jgi:hypothetical protein
MAKKAATTGDGDDREKARDAVSALVGERGLAEYDLGTAEEEIAARLLENERDLRDRLRIDPSALEDEFVRCPGDIAYIAGLHAKAMGVHLIAKIRQKRLRALLTAEARQALINLGSKATVAEVEAAVDSDIRWIEAQVEEDTANVLREDAKGKLLAAVAKRDMIIQMGANFRAEMQRDPSIRDSIHGQRQIARERRELGPADPSIDVDE